MEPSKAQGLAEAIAALRVAAERLGALGDALGAPEALTLRSRAALDQIASGAPADAAGVAELREMGLADPSAGRPKLSARGRALLGRLRAREDAVLTEIAAGLSAETIAALIPALGALNVELERVAQRLMLEDAQRVGQDDGGTVY